MTGIELVVAHEERATIRVGDLFLKIDSDPERLAVEVAAMRTAPVPTAPIRWFRPPVLALGALPGLPLGRLGTAASAPSSAWTAVGAVVRRLHDTTPPDRPSGALTGLPARLDAECERLVAEGVLPADLVDRNRAIAAIALRPAPDVFVHGDLQTGHVFVDGDDVTGILDWSESGRGPAAADLATLTLGHGEHLADVLAGYGPGVDADAVRAWWSLRSLIVIRWLLTHGFDPFAPGGEVDVLRAAGSLTVPQEPADTPR